MDHIKVIDTSCPHCGARLNSSLNSQKGEHHPPTVNDPSVCVYCAGVSGFNEELQLVKPDREMLELWRADADVWQAIDESVTSVKLGRTGLNPHN